MSGKTSKLMRLEPPRLVLIDETDSKTNMTAMYGRALKGTAHSRFSVWTFTALAGNYEANDKKGKTNTFIAGLRHDGITASPCPAVKLLRRCLPLKGVSSVRLSTGLVRDVSRGVMAVSGASTAFVRSAIRALT